MKKGIFTIGFAAAVALVSCNQDANTAAEGEKNAEATISTETVDNTATAEGAVDAENAPAFNFEKDVHEFGDIIQGEKVSYSFTFTNTGKSDLIISSAKGSCGCTVPEYSKDPVAPGASGKIDVVFDSKGKKGQQNKKVTLVANTEPSQTILTIKGNVLEPVPGDS